MKVIACLIVKDEAHVIRRCIESLVPHVDAFVIHDTGSTDRTIDVIRDALVGRSREVRLNKVKWMNFGANRNAVLGAARGWFPGDDVYALTIDADEILETDDAVIWDTIPDLLDGVADGYTLDVEYAGTRYRRTALIRLASPWRWLGPVHEYLDLPGAKIEHLNHPTVRVFHEGARSQNPDTYREDAAVLEQALLAEPGHPRWEFYLAQSYRDAGLVAAAYEAYLVRSESRAGWWEERWFAEFQAGRMAEKLGLDPCGHYLAAFEMNPARCEPLVSLACYERLRDRFNIAAMYAGVACKMDVPADGLFIDSYAYDVGRWDERAIAAYYTGTPDPEAAREAINGSPNDPRLQENLRLSLEAVQ